MPRFETPLVPRNSISGRALVAVVAIMTFLASLTTGAVMLVEQRGGRVAIGRLARSHHSGVPAPGRDVDATVDKAAAAARAFPGIAEVRRFQGGVDKAARALAGQGLSLDELPVPRLIVVKIAPGAAPDFAQLRRVLAEQVPGATSTITAAGSTACAPWRAPPCRRYRHPALMFAATMLSVTFATRGAMATNKPVIEVLHFVGAKNGFIARHFQHHFLMLGLQGGVIGGGAAIILFAVAGVISRWFAGTAAGDQASAFFGSFSIGLLGYVSCWFRSL